MPATRYEDVRKLAESLSADEQLRLIADLATASRSTLAEALTHSTWIDLLGTAPYPALGEDAQAWVSRTRQESDDARSR